MLQSTAHRHMANSHSDYCILSMTEDVYQDLLRLDEPYKPNCVTEKSPQPLQSLPTQYSTPENSWSSSSSVSQPLANAASSFTSGLLDPTLSVDLSFQDNSWQSAELPDWSVLLESSVQDPLPVFADNSSYIQTFQGQFSESFDEVDPGLVDSLSSHSGTPLHTPSSSALPLSEPQFCSPYGTSYPLPAAAYSGVALPDPPLQFAMSQAQRPGFMDRFLNARQFMTPPAPLNSPAGSVAPLQPSSSQYPIPPAPQMPVIGPDVQYSSVAAGTVLDPSYANTADFFDFASHLTDDSTLSSHPVSDGLDFSFPEITIEDVKGKRKVQDEVPLPSPKRAKVQEDLLSGFDWDSAFESLQDTQHLPGEASGSIASTSYLAPEYDFMNAFGISAELDFLNNISNFDSNVLSLDVVGHAESFVS